MGPVTASDPSSASMPSPQVVAKCPLKPRKTCLCFRCRLAGLMSDECHFGVHGIEASLSVCLFKQLYGIIDITKA